ncbi:hypothetical protein AB0J81_08665 [Streptomyces bobili]|uniref:hypothetical protein n=1 Tax=Streptomyces bobili TaxID=67280 RepID=UPI0034139436
MRPVVAHPVVLRHHHPERGGGPARAGGDVRAVPGVLEATYQRFQMPSDDLAVPSAARDGPLPQAVRGGSALARRGVAVLGPGEQHPADPVAVLVLRAGRRGPAGGNGDGEFEVQGAARVQARQAQLLGVSQQPPRSAGLDVPGRGPLPEHIVAAWQAARSTSVA